jgi:alpha-tubulin suppressor-like RCC1 family protein
MSPHWPDDAVGWGRNDRAQLGDGSDVPRANPASVKGLDRIRALAAGRHNSLALRDDGTVLA